MMFNAKIFLMESHNSLKTLNIFFGVCFKKDGSWKERDNWILTLSYHTFLQSNGRFLNIRSMVYFSSRKVTCPICIAEFLEKLTWDSQQCRERTTSGCNKKKISIMPIFFLYYEESLVSSNFNSSLLRFHFARPRVKYLLTVCRARKDTYFRTESEDVSIVQKMQFDDRFLAKDRKLSLRTIHTTCIGF